jgi:dynein heavy chain
MLACKLEFFWSIAHGIITIQFSLGEYDLQSAVELIKVYKEHYKLAKEQLASQPKSKQFDFDEHAIFFKADLFTKRLNKLIDMFTTIHQFSTLEQHTHIEGLELMIRSLNNIIDDVKRKPYDLLDFWKNQVCMTV